MSKTILFFISLCFMIFFFTGFATAQGSELACSGYSSYMQNDSGLTCFRRCETCAASCDGKHSTPKYDVWGKRRKESEITRANRSKCKNNCANLMDYCIRRARKVEENQKAQGELENQPEETQEGTPTEYSAPPSGNSIYRWTDKNGVVHITNNKNSIPPEYVEQIQEENRGE